MKIDVKGNSKEVTFRNGLNVLVSYDTPVAFHRAGELPRVTDRKFSVTTSKHINQWIKRNGFKETVKVSQEDVETVFNNLK